MQLSKRLQLVASFVSEGKRAADIGTDHGYVPIFLAERGMIPYGYACDVNRGPLQRAKEHIAEAGLEEKIETRLGSGLSVLHPGEAEAVIIAGMGGPLMIRLLEEGESVTAEASELILSPHSEIPEVRRALHRLGFQIVQEAMVVDDGKFYTVMKAVHGTEEPYTEMEYRFGKSLIGRSDSVLKEYLQDCLRKLGNLQNRLKEAGFTIEQERMQETAEEIEEIRRLYENLN